MRSLLLIVVGVCYCVAEAPYPPSGTKPEGPLLVLPGEYGPPINKAGVEPREPNRGDISVEEANARLMERLRQEAGSERGVYHVYLSDGRLQRVQYTTAPIRPQSQPLSENYLEREVTDGQADPAGIYYVKVPEGRVQALKAQQQAPTNSKQVSSSSPIGRDEAGVKSRLASIHFMDVEPIPPPIYSLNPKPLARILRGVPVPRI